MAALGRTGKLAGIPGAFEEDYICIYIHIYIYACMFIYIYIYEIFYFTKYGRQRGYYIEVMGR